MLAYSKKHQNEYEGYSEAAKKEKIKKLKSSWNKQQQLFKKYSDQNEAIVRASFYVSELIAKHGKPFSDGEFVKKCLVAVSSEIAPEIILLEERNLFPMIWKNS